MTKQVTKHRILTLVMVVLIAMLSCLSANAMTCHGHDQGRSKTKIYSDTWFTPGVKSNPKFDKKMKSGKWIVSCTSKVVEGGTTVSKKTKTLTAAQAKSSKTGMQEAYASKTNNPIQSQQYKYNWSYL